MESFLSDRAIGSSEKTVNPRASASGFMPLFVQSPSPNNAAKACNTEDEAKIEVVKGKDGIDRIIVTCTCGKRIELKCEYES
jgi:hypothetical protein